MKLADFLGTDLAVMVSDPWDFVTEVGAGPFIGRVLETIPDALLLGLSKPLVYQGRDFQFFIATQRHEHPDLVAVASGQMVPANFYSIPASEVDADNPFAYKWWLNGQVMLIGSLQQT